MTAFLLRRIALIVPTLFFVSVLIFGLQQLLPGDPALALAGENQDPAVIAYLHQKYHLDQPLPVRYVLWVQGVLQGDLGESIRIKRPVFDLICEKLPVSGERALLALVVALVIGVPAGIIAAVKHNTAVDYGASMAALWGLSIPNFWLGILTNPVVFGRIGAVAGLRLRRSWRQPEAEPADVGDAGLRARQCDCCGDDAAHPQRDAAGAEFGLRRYCPCQGARRAAGHPALRLAERACAGGDPGCARIRSAAVGCGIDRAGVHDS